jgi:hypothetical protein
MQVQATSVSVDATTLVSAQISGHTQLPHLPPQPLLPQVLPAQFGTQVAPQVPSAPQVPPPLQLPVAHLPPQPSASPQALPVQLGVQLVQ